MIVFNAVHVIVREYVFNVFSKSKNATFYVFWSVMSKNVKNAEESTVQVFTFLHFEIDNGHFHCETITHMSCYTYNIILQEAKLSLG